MFLDTFDSRQLFRPARRGGQLLVARRGLLRSRAEEVEAFLDMDRHALIFQAPERIMHIARLYFGDWFVTDSFTCPLGDGTAPLRTWPPPHVACSLLQDPACVPDHCLLQAARAGLMSMPEGPAHGIGSLLPDISR